MTRRSFGHTPRTRNGRAERGAPVGRDFYAQGAGSPWLFFLLAAAFTWLFWVPDALGKRGVLPDTVLTNLGAVGAFGPLVAALCLVSLEPGCW